ncbi:MAG: RecX family transcriptional regulator [Betaproteobacteria bacterium]|jgi:regulatory protein
MPGVRAPASLRQQALMWLAQRDHSRKELHDKLQRWVQALEAARALAPAVPWPDAQQIPALLNELEAAGHLSDARVVESRIHVRAARFGNLRIERELQHLGVGADEPARAVLRASELQRAQSVWARKFGQPPASAAERARHMRFLAGRGFTADTIRTVLRGVSEDEERDLDT